MPNRILKESICTSETIDELTPEEECFFYRILVNCDDYGRSDARIAVLTSRCYPLRASDIKRDHVEKMLLKLQKVNLLFLYSDGKYLQIRTWDKHQQIRAKRSKYPEPLSSEINGNQMISDVGNIPAYAPVIQSNPNPNPNPNPIIVEVLEYLNERAGTNFRAVDAHKRHIQARVHEGYTLEDFQIVIDKKCSEWLNTEQQKYLRPETLFGTKFDGYLNQQGGNPKTFIGKLAEMEREEEYEPT